MKKLMTSLLVILAISILSSCATTPKLDPIEQPVCETDSVGKVCLDVIGGAPYIVDADEECNYPVEYWGVLIGADCFRKLDKYWGQLEIRNESCAE